MRACFIIILILVMGSANAAKITVGPKDADYSQIQQAIDNASAGDVIEVQSGIYRENLYVIKMLELQGIDTGSGLPVVDAGGSGSAITLLSNGTMVRGFNFTGSGHCGCGNAGILVQSGNNTVEDNVVYRNKYGIYVRPGNINNTFLSNDLLENNITAHDTGGNLWNGRVKLEGLLGLMIGIMGGERLTGNHYSDYDEPAEGCNDTNRDGFCDAPKKIEGGPDIDYYPSIS